VTTPPEPVNEFQQILRVNRHKLGLAASAGVWLAATEMEINAAPGVLQARE